VFLLFFNVLQKNVIQFAFLSVSVFCPDYWARLVGLDVEDVTVTSHFFSFNLGN